MYSILFMILLLLSHSTPLKLSQDINKLTIDLYKKVDEVDHVGNIAFSPFSLHTALSMALEGSEQSSTTHQELAKLILGDDRLSLDDEYQNSISQVYSNLSSPEDIKLMVANKVFSDDDFRLSGKYRDVLQRVYHSAIETVDFSQPKAAGDTINTFVDRITQGLIKETVSPEDIDPLTRLVLINALYFKADWKVQFNEALTKPMDFQNLPEKYPFGMNMKSDLKWTNLASSSGFDAEVLELPYKNTNYRMLLILPHTHLQDLDMNQLDFDQLNSRLQRTRARPVQLTLPRFKMDHEVKQMKDILKALGVVDMFDYRLANFKKISDTREDIFVSDVIHKAVIEVNEQGSEAAAVTAVVFSARCVGCGHHPTPPHVMNFDKPFLFVIQEAVHQIPLFFGRVTKPNAANDDVQPRSDLKTPKKLQFQEETMLSDPDSKAAEYSHKKSYSVLSCLLLCIILHQ